LLSGLVLLKFGQEISRNCEIMRLDEGDDERLRSGVEAWDVVLFGVPAIFLVCEVHGLEYPPGLKFQ